MLWWDDLLKNIQPLMDNNLSTQEGQVEGQVVNDQNVGSQKGNQEQGGFKGRYKERIKVEKKWLKLRDNPDDKEPKFKAYVGEGKFVSQYVRTCINHGHVDEELDNVTSNEDLKKIVAKLLAEYGDKKKPNKYSKMTEEELLLNLAYILEALEEKKDKSLEEWYKDAQEVVDKRELERIDKEEEEAREAKARRDARREAILSKAKQTN
nr:MAG TPA: hypothetical protein [Caudoviricetes sp.]